MQTNYMTVFAHNMFKMQKNCADFTGMLAFFRKM